MEPETPTFQRVPPFGLFGVTGWRELGPFGPCAGVWSQGSWINFLSLPCFGGWRGINRISMAGRKPNLSPSAKQVRSLFPHRAKSPTLLSPLWYRQTAGTAVGRGQGRSPTQSSSAGSAAGTVRSGGAGLLRWALAHAAPRRPHHLPSPVAPITCGSPPCHDWEPLPARVREGSDPPPGPSSWLRGSLGRRFQTLPVFSGPIRTRTYFSTCVSEAPGAWLLGRGLEGVGGCAKVLNHSPLSPSPG